jgi:hypothetical protein
MHGVPDSLATVVFSSLALAPALHESTSPEALAALHREEVAAFFARRPHATVEEASAALTLPVWNVARHLAALAGRPTPYKAKRVVDSKKAPSWPTKVKKGRKQPCRS